MRAPVLFFLVRLWKDSKLPNPIYHPPSPTSRWHMCGCHGRDGRHQPYEEGCKYTPYCMEYILLKMFIKCSNMISFEPPFHFLSISKLVHERFGRIIYQIICWQSRGPTKLREVKLDYFRGCGSTMAVAVNNQVQLKKLRISKFIQK